MFFKKGCQMRLNLVLAIIFAFNNSILFASEKVEDWQNMPILYKADGHDGLVCNHKRVIGAPQTNSFNTLGKNVTIAVIDPGIFDCNKDINHALTEATKQRHSNVKVSGNESDSHPNWVASIIANKKNGIFPQAKLEVFTVPEEKCKTSCVVNAIDEAIKLNVDFISISMGWGANIGDSSEKWQKDEFPEKIAAAIYRAAEKNIGVLIAAGNYSTQSHRRYLGHNKYKNIADVLNNSKGALRFVVATEYTQKENETNIDEKVAWFSNVMTSNDTGNELWKYAIAAPGVNILYSDPDGKESVCNGTSAATPMVAAAAAFIKRQFPHLNSIQVLDVLDRSSRTTVLPSTRETKEEYIKRVTEEELSNRFYRYLDTKSEDENILDDSEDVDESKEYASFVEKAYQVSLMLFDRDLCGRGVIDIQNALKIAKELKIQ